MEDRFTLRIRWRSVMATEARAYNFPQKFTPLMKDQYSVPAVYRWKVVKTQAEGSKECIYIGEAEDLLRRIQRVLTPPKQTKKINTNRRLNDIFTKYVAESRIIVVDVADVEPFEVDGVRFGRDTIGDRFKRRAGGVKIFV